MYNQMCMFASDVVLLNFVPSVFLDFLEICDDSSADIAAICKYKLIKIVTNNRLFLLYIFITINADT
jgi:hypothetical protein